MSGQSAQRAPLRFFPTLLLYGLPAAPLAALTGPVFTVLPTHYSQGLGLDLAAVGVALLLARLWDTLCDPAIGVLSDRTASRFGRRRPWMLAGLPLTLLGAYFVLCAQPGVSVWAVGLASIVLYTGWTMVKLNFDAWGAEMSPDYAERVRITAAREGFGIVGGIVVILLLGWAVMPQGPGLGQALVVLFGLVAVWLLISVPLLLWRVREAPQAPSRPQSLGDIWRPLAQNQPLRQLALAWFLNTLAAALPATLFLLFVEFGLGRPDMKGPLIILYFLSAVLAVPFWSWAGRRFGKHIAWRWSMIIAAVSFAPVFFFGPGELFGIDLMIYFAGVCVITGACLAGDLLLPPAIQADVVDVDSASSGAQRAGLMFAILGLLAKLAYAVAVGVAFPVLAGAGFDQTPGARNSPEALVALAALYALVPAALKLAAIFAMKDFSLTRDQQMAVRQSLESGQTS
jgi:glycoside/pentoside/hexuronide:cation symporter, GPH family